jgi:hypothetical protein
MPDRELIHSTADVSSMVLYALDSGFQVMLDSPQPEPRPRMLARMDVNTFKEGVFLLFRPEWVYGNFRFMPISDGFNCGKFFVQPRTNFSPISVYFSGERIVEGQRKLGAGTVSFDRDWLELPAKALRDTPPDVEVWFKRIFTHVASRAVIKAGVHRYYVCRGVIADPNREDCLPPFDFIPWPNETLKAVQESKTRRRRNI